ncbi:hypothetical protein [Devosia geojensis]|uniref:hypothetical protein n=1 Tax=Devosia geojensis TaxID=443610 RepID=UPI000AFC904D|nr:hypothetical protein [Devosia geojensis]
MDKSQSWTPVRHRADEVQVAYDTRPGTYELLLSLAPAAITLAAAVAVMLALT